MGDSINQQLSVFQEEWFKNVFIPCAINKYPNSGLSYPFYVGVSNEFENANKKIMIVGQETRGWSKYKPDWGVEDSRSYNIDYLRYQLGDDDRPELKEKWKHKNKSPFWNFYRKFYREGVVPCWNNIDKAQRSIDGKTLTLTEDIERELNRKLKSGKTLFQKEVEIINPDIILFVTGPNYRVTMSAAMSIPESSLPVLSYENGCLDITNVAGFKSKTFWTYHPRHIASKKNILNREEIVKIVLSE